MRRFCQLGLLVAAVGCVGCQQAADAPAAQSGGITYEEHNQLKKRFQDLLREHQEREEVQQLSRVRDELESAQRTIAALKLAKAKEAERSGNPLGSIEDTIRGATGWSQLDASSNQRTFGHASGARVEFGPDELGVERMRLTYDTKDELQSKAGTLVQMLIPGLSAQAGQANDEAWTANSDSIARWFGSPIPVVSLHGGFIHISARRGSVAQWDVYANR
ncbi:MAG: hypothetical protein AAGJ46_20935 [Planctomycetota bacterium]